MSTEAEQVNGLEDTSKIEEAAAPIEVEKGTAATSAEPVKVEEGAATLSPSINTEVVKDTVDKPEKSPKEIEEVSTDNDSKERNGPLKVLAAIKRNLASPKKGDKKEEVEAVSEDQSSSPNSKEKVLDKLVGRMFKKDECSCKHTDTEEKVLKTDDAAAAPDTSAKEQALVIAEDAATSSEEKKEVDKEDKSKGKQLYVQIVKALSPRKSSSGKQSSASSSDSTEVDTTEVPVQETPAEAALSDKSKKETESEPASPGVLTTIKKKATDFVHSLEDKVSKDKESNDKETKGKEEPKGEEKVEQSGKEVTAVVVAPVEEQVAPAETSVEQVETKEETKKGTKKEMVGKYIDVVVAKIHGALSKDQDTKEINKSEEVPVAAQPTAKGEKTIEQPQASNDKKKETFPVNELTYENEEKKKENEVADTQTAATTTEQTSQKWKNRMSGLFKVKKSTAEEHTEPETSTSTSIPTPAEAVAVVPAAPKEMVEVQPVATATASQEGEAKDSALRLAQLYMQTPATQEALKQEADADGDKTTALLTNATAKSASVEAPTVSETTTVQA